MTKRDNSQRIAYLYDSQGNRTVKTVTTRQTDGTDRVTSTYYVRDAQGNVLSVYERVVTAATPNASITQSEIYLYGSSRMGVYKPRANRSVATNGIYSRSLRLKEYELTDHLGNVRAVVGDYRQSDGANPVRVALLRYYNQYAVGLDMPLMTWQGTGGGYRFGFNGQEKSPEIDASHNPVQLGGDRGSLNPLDPDSRRTWQVAANPLTWIVRSVTIKAQVQVNAEGSMNITYSFTDNLDLRPEIGEKFILVEQEHGVLDLEKGLLLIYMVGGVALGSIML